LSRQNRNGKYLWLDELSTKEAAQAAENGAVVIFPVVALKSMGFTCRCALTAFSLSTLRWRLLNKRVLGCAAAMVWYM
jgi:hypothetical protein